MNQLQQVPEIPPTKFRQKGRGLREFGDGDQIPHLLYAQTPQPSGLNVLNTFSGLKGLRVGILAFGNVSTSMETLESQQVGVIGAGFNILSTDIVPNPVKNAELNWLHQHSAETAGYVGQWLLISGDTLVAHSQNFAEIKNAIATQNISSPFVYYVPTEAESSFVIL
jgi:Family of unknown function (DUF5678)